MNFIKNEVCFSGCINDIIDSLKIDYEIIKNGVLLPINQEVINKENYRNIFWKLVELETGTTHITSDTIYTNLDLVVVAKDGHKIHNYDGEYDYYIGGHIPVPNMRITRWPFRMLPLKLSNENAKTLQGIMWKNRNIRLSTRLQVEDAIAEYITRDNLELFVDRYDDADEYKGVWRSTTNDVGIAAMVRNASNGSSAVELFTMGYKIDKKYIGRILKSDKVQ